MSVDVPDLFAGAKPTEREQYVLNQGFTRDLDYGRGLLPDTRIWPAKLDRLAISDGHDRVDRRTLFVIARRAAADATDPLTAFQCNLRSCSGACLLDSRSCVQSARSPKIVRRGGSLHDRWLRKG